VPIVINQPVFDDYLKKAKTRRLKSHQVFNFAMNGVAH